LDVLRWAREQDCPWDGWTCAQAIACEHYELLTWAVENGCPWDGRTYAAMLATAVAAEEAARLAEASLEIFRGKVASIGLAVAVEAFRTWRTSSHSGRFFLLILLVRPLVLVFLDLLVIFLVLFLVTCVQELYVDPPPFFTPRQRRLIILIMLFFLLLLLVIGFLMFLSFLILGISTLVVFVLLLPGLELATQALVG
jgi:hypothetical protein